MDELAPSRLLPTDARKVALLYEVGQGLASLRDMDELLPYLMREVAVPRHRGIAGRVLEHAEPALVSDAASDPRFYGGVDESLARTTPDLACAPLRAREDALVDLAGCAVIISHYQDYESARRKRLGAEAEGPHPIKYRRLTG